MTKLRKSISTWKELTLSTLTTAKTAKDFDDIFETAKKALKDSLIVLLKDVGLENTFTISVVNDPDLFMWLQETGAKSPNITKKDLKNLNVIIIISAEKTDLVKIDSSDFSNPDVTSSRLTFLSSAAEAVKKEQLPKILKFICKV